MSLTKADLAENVFGKLGLSKTESKELVELFFKEIFTSLEKGWCVKISGFGTFVLRDKGERTGRNPKTGVEVPIAPRRVLTFRASQTMCDRIIAAG